MDELLLAQPRGFCAGVDRAIEIVEKAIETYGAARVGVVLGTSTSGVDESLHALRTRLGGDSAALCEAQGRSPPVMGLHGIGRNS